MAEPVPQVVAQMPKAKLIGLLALFLGPAVVIYTAFSIYPLLATMQLSTYSPARPAAAFISSASPTSPPC